MNFFKLKMKEASQQVLLAVQDVREENTSLPLFSRQDFDRILRKLEDDIKETTESELTNFYRMSAVFVQMLLYDAEQQNSTLSADLKHMENYKALSEMKDLETQDPLSFGASRKVAGRGLPALGT